MVLLAHALPPGIELIGDYAFEQLPAEVIETSVMAAVFPE